MSATIEEPAILSARYGHFRCLLCGNLNPRSLNLSFRDAGDGVVSARFKADVELQDYHDILHGGVIAALLDASMTHCLTLGIEAAGRRILFDTGQGPAPSEQRADPIDDDPSLQAG